MTPAAAPNDAADRLRGKGGLSYSAASMFNASSLDPRATITIMAIYNPRNLAKVEAGVREEVERIAKEGVTPDELKQAKEGWLRREEIGRAEDGSLASSLASNLFLGRTLQFDADVEAKVKGIIAEQLGVGEDEIKPESSFIDDLGADSLDIVELVMAMEEEFEVEIPDEEAENIKTVGDAINYINTHKK